MIIDSHIHLWLREMLPDKLVEIYLEPLLALKDVLDLKVNGVDTVWPEYGADTSQLLEMMDDCRTDKVIALPIDFGLVEKPRSDIEQYNEWVFENCSAYPDKIIPFVGVDPQRGDHAIELVEKFVKRYNARGVKVYPATGWYPNEERILPFWKAMEDLGMAIVTHSGAAWGPLDDRFTEPRFYEPVFQRFPDLKIVIAHLGGKWRMSTFEICQRYENAYADISAIQGWLPSDPETAKSRLREVAEKIPNKASFGTDWPLFDLQYSSANWLRFCQETDWADEDIKEKVLGGNMRKVLGI